MRFHFASEGIPQPPNIEDLEESPSIRKAALPGNASSDTFYGKAFYGSMTVTVLSGALSRR